MPALACRRRVARLALATSCLALALPSGARAAVFPCSEAGLVAAAAAGGGPHTFDCPGPTTVTVSAVVMLPAPLILDGEDRLTVSGGNITGVFFATGVGTPVVELRNLTVTEGTGVVFGPGQTNGGCILSDAPMVLRNVTIRGCSATSAGGGYLGIDDLTLIGSRVLDNHAGQSAGGIGRAETGVTVISDSVISGNTAAQNGGGILSSNTPLTIADSTISGNRAAAGGGVFVGATFASPGDHVIVRSSISGNTATLGGGGISVATDQIEIADSTIAYNTNGGIAIGPMQFFEDRVIRGTTIAGNSGPMGTAIFHGPFPPANIAVYDSILSGTCSAPIVSGGGNVESPGDTCGLGLPSDQSSVSGAALHLGKLGPHGGPTWTIPLKSPSVAIDAAPGCSSATDQRGVARPQGAACDAGAFEFDGAQPVPALPPIGVAVLVAALAVASRPAPSARRHTRAAATLAVLVLALTAAADAAVYSCDEPGVLAALAAGGGPHTFSCSGPTTVETSAELVISQSVELDGSGLMTLSGGDAHRVFRLPADSTVGATLRNLVIRDGRAPGSTSEFGGCIYALASLTLENVEVSGCQGFGAVMSDHADLTLIDSSIHGNHGVGIGARAFGTSEHVLTITRTRVHGNQVAGVSTVVPTFVTDSTIAGNDGIGIDVGGIWTGGYTVISRSTISHNVGGTGGLVVSAGYAEVLDSTFAGNLPVAVFNRQVNSPPDQFNNVQIRNSTLVGNAGTAASTIREEPCPPPQPHIDCWYATVENTILSGEGYARSNGGNVFSPLCNAFPQPSDQCVPAAELNLGKLGPHGGPTWTVPLKAPSVAIDGAPGCTSATDQRGVIRPQGAACDVGAFEYDGAQPVPALPPLAVAALLAAVAAAGMRALRARRRT